MKKKIVIFYGKPHWLKAEYEVILNVFVPNIFHQNDFSIYYLNTTHFKMQNSTGSIVNEKSMIFSYRWLYHFWNVFFYSYWYILGLKFKYYLFLPEHNFDRPNAAESSRYSSSKICKENSKALCFMSSRSLAHTLAFPSY